jgi:cellulose synthase/poly-beta-1,6-N-acetylglucosamine synthase-like glycosyltransferase
MIWEWWLSLMSWSIWVVISYFVLINCWYFILLLSGIRGVMHHQRIEHLRDYDLVNSSELSLPISIIAPAYNEGPVVVSSVRSLVDLGFANLEVLVVNDGSSDDTMDLLTKAFDLIAVQHIPRTSTPCAAIRGVYISRTHPHLRVIDKENGGKADALNAGLRYARYPLFCAIDCDTFIEAGALSRLTWIFQSSPETVACGGMIRVVNGVTIRNGQVTDIRTPLGQWLVSIQILEYLRAFLGARVGMGRHNMLLVISGAFGIFRRQPVVEIGGYDITTVGEDAELIAQLHRYFRDQKVDYKISFLPDPVCWTEAPSSARVLARQRDRWQRGLLQTLWRCRGMFFKARYGRVGSVLLPCYLFFEAFGPLIELWGYSILFFQILTGSLNVQWASAFLLLAVGWGLVLSFGALIIEELSFRRYRRWRDLGKLFVCALVENIGYRQWMTLVRSKAFWTQWRNSRSGRDEWGDMTRAGFGEAVEAEAYPEGDESGPKPS